MWSRRGQGRSRGQIVTNDSSFDLPTPAVLGKKSWIGFSQSQKLALFWIGVNYSCISDLGSSFMHVRDFASKVPLMNE
jgi:hypothetical protein